MTRVQKTVEQQLAEVQAKRQKLDERARQLSDRQKALDLRRRAKGEKALLQLTLDRLAGRDDFRAALLDQLDAASLKPEDRAAVLWLLTGARTNEAKPAGAVASGA